MNIPEDLQDYFITNNEDEKMNSIMKDKLGGAYYLFTSDDIENFHYTSMKIIFNLSDHISKNKKYPCIDVKKDSINPNIICLSLFSDNRDIITLNLPIKDFKRVFINISQIRDLKLDKIL